MDSFNLNTLSDSETGDIYSPFLDGVSCPEGWLGYRDGYCYKLFTSEKNFTAAEVKCLEEDAHLISILNSGENEFLYGIMTGV